MRLRIEQVSHLWAGRKEILGPLSAEAPAGTLIGLIGPNGAGKSTLLKIIAAYLKPRSGIVTIDGHDVATLPPSERAKLLAMVPQTLDTHFDLTAEEVVELGRLSHLSWRQRMSFEPSRDDGEIPRAMLATETLAFKNRPFNTLSGGEAKRVLLAAALAQKTRVLLLDEPTAHLDPGHALKFLDLVHDLVRREGLTCLMAYHDLTTVGLYADQIWVLHAGQMALHGSPDEVLDDPLMEDIYETPLLKMHHPRTHKLMLLFP